MTETVELEILEWSAEIDKIAPALVAAQRAFAPIAKTEEGKVDTDKAKYSYRYADLAGVLAATVPALNANGIFFSQPSAIMGFRATCVTLLMHESGQWVKSRLTLTAKNDDPQKLGGALTYARRYAANGMLGVSPQEDDDGKGAGQVDESAAALADLQAEFGEYTSAVTAIGRRILSRAVPPEWQVTTASALSSGRTKVWSELLISEMLAFYRRMGNEFTSRVETEQKLSQDAPEPDAEQTPADVVQGAVRANDDALVAEREAKRQIAIAWYAEQLSKSDATDDELQSYASVVRDQTLAADPDADLSITYDWRELNDRELKEFYGLVPKKPRAKAGVA